MNESVTTTNGPIAADSVDGVFYQRAKAVIGVDGEADDVSRSNPMPVEVYGLLGELIKAVDALRVVDQAQRQRITLDAISAALTLATVTTVGTVSAVSNISAGTLTNLIANAGMDREQYINIAAQAYALAIRPQLQFT